MQNKIGRVMQKQSKQVDSSAQRQSEKYEKQQKKSRQHNKKIATSLGVSQVNNIHLQKYTKDLKTLIGQLYDDNLDAVYVKNQI